MENYGVQIANIWWVILKRFILEVPTKHKESTLQITLFHRCLYPFRCLELYNLNMIVNKINLITKNANQLID